MCRQQKKTGKKKTTIVVRIFFPRFLSVEELIPSFLYHIPFDCASDSARREFYVYLFFNILHQFVNRYRIIIVIIRFGLRAPPAYNMKRPMSNSGYSEKPRLQRLLKDNNAFFRL